MQDSMASMQWGAAQRRRVAMRAWSMALAGSYHGVAKAVVAWQQAMVWEREVKLVRDAHNSVEELSAVWAQLSPSKDPTKARQASMRWLRSVLHNVSRGELRGMMKRWHWHAVGTKVRDQIQVLRKQLEVAQKALEVEKKALERCRCVLSCIRHLSDTIRRLI